MMRSGPEVSSSPRRYPKTIALPGLLTSSLINLGAAFEPMHAIAARSRASELLQGRIVARATWNKPRLVDAAFLLEKHPVWESTQSRRRLAASALPAVLVKHPLRHSHLYAIYVSRKHMPLEVRTFIDHLIEATRIPQ
jgi:hypothetical protein